MSKVVDITEKLSFDENPKLKVKSIEVEVNADAPTMLKLLQLIGDGREVTPNDVVKMYEMLFSEAGRKKIDSLKLQFKDFQTFVMAAMNLVVGDAPSGE